MSDDRKEELKKNILSPSQWIRILYMAFYAVACWVLVIALSVIIIAQVLISLLTGADNENLRSLGKKASDYFHEILDFLVYDSHDKPWPFTENSAPDNQATTATPAAKPQPAATQEQAGGDDVFADISFTDTVADDDDEPDGQDTDAPENISDDGKGDAGHGDEDADRKGPT